MSHIPDSLILPHRADLQGLRAIAILLVVLAHAGVPQLAGGFIGVDVFFVLSGYLITGLLLREIEQSGHIDFVRFYGRRMQRLLPAMVVMLGVVFSMTFWLLSEEEAHAQLASAPFATTWTSNLYYAFTRFDYFDELATRDLFIHTWSLGVEEQFYLFWPVLLLAIIRVGHTRQTAKLYGIGLGVLFLVSFAASFYWTVSNAQFGFYMMPSRIWQFALGGAIHITLASTLLNLRVNGTAAWIALGTGSLLIIGSAFFLHPNLAYPGAWALLPSFGTALVIVAGHNIGKANPLSHPLLVWIGDRSYSLYLWHWPILVLGFSLGFQGQAAPTLGLILLALLLAMISYRHVEQPFWKGRASHASSSLTLLVGLLTIAISFFSVFHGLRNPPQQAVTKTELNVSTKWRMDMPEIYRMPCDTWFTDARVEPCVFGTKTSTKTVVLLGDSIGVQWFSLISGIFEKPTWRTIVLTKSSCPILDVEFFYARIGKTYQVCTDWRNAVIDDLISLKPDVLVMGSAISGGFSESQWVEGTTRILQRLSKSVGTIILVPGTPNLGFDGPGCIARNLSPTGQFDRSACIGQDRIQAVDPIKLYLEKAAARFPNVHLVDLNDLVCPEGNCNAISDDGLVVFRDSQHLTDTFVRSRIPAASNRFDQIFRNLHQR